MGQRFRRSAFWIVGLVALTLSIPASGQEVSAGITGSVKDPAGASIAGASVTAKDEDRGTMWPTTSSSDGLLPCRAFRLAVMRFA